MLRVTLQSCHNAEDNISVLIRLPEANNMSELPICCG